MVDRARTPTPFGIWRSPDIYAFELILCRQEARWLGADENGQPKQRVSGARLGQAKHKILRHDVVMEAKRRMGWKELSQDDRPDLAHVIQEAASSWLLDRSDSIGCRIEHDSLRVDGHTVHRMRRERHRKDGKAICLSTDFDGVPEVFDPVRFLSRSLQRCWPSKSLWLWIVACPKNAIIQLFLPLMEDSHGNLQSEDLPVWQEAIRLAEGVYDMTESRAWRGSPSLRDQIERAALSVSNANIAEGFERGTTKELLAFLYIARGSVK